MSMFETLANRIREINDANGFNLVRPEHWKECPLMVIGQIGLIHTEITELESESSTRDEFAEELADIKIRVLDCMSSVGMEDKSRLLNVAMFSDSINTMDPSSMVRRMRHCLDHASEMVRKNDPISFCHFMNGVLTLVHRAAECMQIDVDEVVEAKLAKNRDRGYRHGNKTC